ncbi:uncharacterized protein DUF748 [Anseongella ginsenosidimutans]|uniref:Uncharacterized protein DUF748 n=2 Tax=Anseongella ginsenosidimutans TaxID=496056 RepID=A0A4R3KW68_9SPHI|nr:uncharacterized protein DUF748 [Anseongella ginsenosidimutans]
MTLSAVVVLSLFLLLIIVNSIIIHFAKPRLVAYLKETVYKASDSLYTLDFDKIRMNLIRGSADISEVYLRPDTALYASLRSRGAGPPLLFDLHSEHLKIRGVHLFKLWRSKKLAVDLISIEKPDIGVLKHVLPEDTLAKPFEFDPYGMIAPVLASLRVDRVRISDGKLRYKKEGIRNGLSLHFNKFFLETDGLYIDSMSRSDTSGSFYSEDLRLSIKDFKFRLPDSLYNLHLGTVRLSSRESRLSIDSLWLEPRHGEMEFHKIQDKETDRLELKTGLITARDFDIRSFLRNEELKAGEILIEDAVLVDFLYNFRMDDRPYQTLPHLALKNAGITLDIRKLVIKNSSAVYRERLAGNSETGQVTFRNLNGIITNISNIPERIAADSVIHANIETSLMDVGSLNVKFDFYMDRDDGYFTVNGSLGRMPMEAINPMLEAAARLKIKRGTLQKLLFTLHGDSTRSAGSMKFYYNNLNVELLGKEDSESNMKIASALTNMLLLYSNNPPPEGPLRTGVISFTRLKNKSIFNYLWKSLLTGFKSSVGISAEKESQLRGMAEKFKERKERREERKGARQERRAGRKAERQADQ